MLCKLSDILQNMPDMSGSQAYFENTDTPFIFLSSLIRLTQTIDFRSDHK